MNNKVVARNIACSLMLQITTIISGFILPKIILSCFGSAVNGLVNSISQFLNYVTLLEGGVSGVIMSSLYKPLANRDLTKVSGIINATRKFFKQIAMIYIVYTAIIAIVYPLLVHTEYSYQYVFVLVWVLASNLFIQYFYSLTYKILLNADRKVYYVSITQIVIIVVNTVLVIIISRLFPNIVVVKLGSALVFFIQPLMYSAYIKKHYQLNPEAPPDTNALSQRWDGFGQNLAFFIHTNTDVVILTLFSSLSMVSVYSVYLMVINAMKGVVSSVSSAIVPSLGNILAKENKEHIEATFKLYEFGIHFVTTLLFTCCMILVVPFIRVYTRGIIDVEYSQPVFSLIMVAAEMVYCVREPYVSMAYAAGHFKQTAKFAYMEAMLNILLSLSLVRRLGIIGVAIGTLVSMTSRMFAQICYLRKNIIYRSILPALRSIVIFGIASGILYVALIDLVAIRINSYITFFLYGIVVFFICSLVLSLIGVLFYRDNITQLLRRTKKTQ